MEIKKFAISILVILMLSGCNQYFLENEPTRPALIDTVTGTTSIPEKPIAPTGRIDPTPVVNGTSIYPLKVEDLTITSLKILEGKEGWQIHISGWLPTPCYTVSWQLDSEQDADYRILVATSKKTENMCVQIIKETDLDIPLPEKVAGFHKIYLNGELIGTIALK